MKLYHTAAMMLLSWTLVIYYGQRERTPVTKTGFPTKQAL
jgi:hypothetical protein